MQLFSTMKSTSKNIVAYFKKTCNRAKRLTTSFGKTGYGKTGKQTKEKRSTKTPPISFGYCHYNGFSKVPQNQNNPFSPLFGTEKAAVRLHGQRLLYCGFSYSAINRSRLFSIKSKNRSTVFSSSSLPRTHMESVITLRMVVAESKT